MKTIKVKAYANLRKYTGGAAVIDVQVAESATVAQILGTLGVPAGEARIVFLNGRAASFDAAPGDGEQIELFSAIGGG